MKDNQPLTFEESIAIQNALEKLTKGRNYILIVDIPDTRGITIVRQCKIPTAISLCKSTIKLFITGKTTLPPSSN